MLHYLKIKNLALIANAEVEFAPGFNVITGESGSGKSVLLNTIGLLTGRRADKNLLRSGCTRCELSAEISVDIARNPEILTALEAAGIEIDSERPLLQLRRVFTASGNRNFLNDTPVTNATLQTIGSLLIDIHSANEHHTLLHRERQLELLDRFGNVSAAKKDFTEKLQNYRALCAERDQKFSALPSADEAAMLRDILEEIEAVAPHPGEDEELNARYKIASNAHEILQIIQNATQTLSEGDTSLVDQLAEVYRELEQLNKLSGGKAEQFLNDAEVVKENLNSLTASLAEYGNSIELDPAAFTELENRLSAIYSLKRHYGPSLTQVLEKADTARERLKIMADLSRLKQTYAEQIQAAEKAMQQAAEKLSEQRKRSAIELCKRVSEKLKVLGFAYNVFRVDFARREIGQTGFDQIEMVFSANPGLNPAPLRLVASSGESARVMLALKAVLADADAIPVLIFDEIDVNIGGATGVRVGEELAQLSQHRQLLCISHLPQVAAQGEYHLAVSKHVEAGIVYGQIEVLSGKSRVKEIGRMLGGTAAAEEHAKALLQERSQIK